MVKQREKQYWLLKTEPSQWSWEDQAAAAKAEEDGGATKWDGVRNLQAKKNLRSMRLGDLCFFYHSGRKSRRVVGVVAVAREWYSDADGGVDDVAVDVRAVGAMRRAVDLGEMKRDGDGGGAMKGFAMLRQPRLSVVAVPVPVWERVCELGGGFEGDGNDDNDEGF